MASQPLLLKRMWKEEKNMRTTNPTFQEANTIAMDRYKESCLEIKSLLADMSQIDNSYEAYFKNQGQFLLMMQEHMLEIEDDAYFDHDFEWLLGKNHMLYEDVTEPGYQTSYVNPSYAATIFGKEMGQFLSAVAYKLREYVGYVYEQRLFDMKETNDLYLALYHAVVVEGQTEVEVLRQLVRHHMVQSAKLALTIEWTRRFSPTFDVYSHIVDSYDLEDLRYLFRYGLFVGDNEIAQAKYVGQLSEDKKQKIADTYTEAYIRGFARNGVSLKGKNSVQVVYSLGFEGVMKKAYNNFEKLGLQPFAYFHLRTAQRPRLISTRPNRQMIYDHRFSDALYLDEAYVSTMLKASEEVAEMFAKDAGAFSGLALFEVFGDEPFQPKNKDANMSHDQKTAELAARYTREMSMITNKIMPGDSYSFTINDYPLPSIGEQYEAIFDATIEVNTLEEALYEKIQSTIIDALDEVDYVHVTGRDGNKTDIKVALMPISDEKGQTKFANCTADVNVPVGEVYTSPVLAGTEGLLHVKEVYLTDRTFKDLKIWFEEGMIKDYTCSNFETEAENKAYVKESLMHPHDTLPLGEFAIGTNTVAYMMGRRFGIQEKLPILIGEKTGPHFAIGDTCFTWAEDTALYNSNGKEMIARENEKTCLRKTSPEKAYTNKHTDITIPYDELGDIVGYDENGDSVEIILNGRFALPGTEVLNRPFDEE